MSKRLLPFVGVALVAALAAGYWFRIPGKQCPGPSDEVEVPDVYIRPFFNKGDRAKARMNWYACNPLKQGDLVLFRYNTGLPPVVRIARGVPGDKFELIQDRANRAWNVKINGKLVMDSSDRPYFFGAETPPTLSLYEKSHQGRLGAGEAIIFSSFSPGDKDSGVSGLVSIDDLIGKIEPRS